MRSDLVDQIACNSVCVCVCARGKTSEREGFKYACGGNSFKAISFAAEMSEI